MKPTFTVTCVNENCAEYEKVIESEDPPLDFGNYSCKSCQRSQVVRIVHGGHEFSNVEVFGRHLVGLTQEVVGLKKLIDRGVAEHDEVERHSELVELLTDVKCTCCLQPHLDEDGVPVLMKTSKKLK